MNVTMQRILLAVVFVLALAAALYLPKAWKSPIDSAMQPLFFGLITLDWIWLRLIKPSLKGGISQGGQAI